MAKGRRENYKERMNRFKSDPEYRSKIFKELLAHIEACYSLDCFPELSDKSILQALKDYPNEFVEAELAISIRKAKIWWEGIGAKQASGQCLGNSRSWYYNMSNRYGWRDRQEVQQEVKGSLNVSIVNYAKPTQSTS